MSISNVYREVLCSHCAHFNLSPIPTARPLVGMKALTLTIATLEVGRQGREWATGDSKRVRVMAQGSYGRLPP